MKTLPRNSQQSNSPGVTIGIATGDKGHGNLIESFPILTGEVSKTLFSDLTGVTGALTNTLPGALSDELAGVLLREAQSSSK